MKINHLAIWVKDLEKSKKFYIKYFGAVANEKYHNPVKKFSSYFLSFGDDNIRLELMYKPNIFTSKQSDSETVGLAHFAFSAGSKEEVDLLTEKLWEEGYKILDGPRTTGDGYYESVIADPDGNRIEITE